MVAYKYNPQNASPEELKQTFTAREQQLADILEELHQQRNSNTNQHYLVIGPRGIGKTNFLRMIYWTINNGCKNGECWLPIQFAEEEYSISSIRDFFEKILEALSSEDTSSEVIEYLNEVKEEKNDSVAYDKSYLFLKKYTTEHNKKILLLVDNLDLVIGDQINDDAEVKQLRSMLMNDNFLTLIGAAPTYFSEVSNYDKPLYNFFKLHNLDELTEEQIEELIRKRAEFDEKTTLINALPTLRPKLKALRHLTGGNPRLILMLYQLLTLSEFMEVKEYLQGLLDDLTPYYQSKLQILSPQQRKIIDTMARAEGAVTPTELAGMTRLNVNVVSTNLKRLMDMGYVKTPKQERRKATYYVISERMFRIWHQMRTSRSMKRKIQFFVEFVQMWFSQEELTDEATRLKTRFGDFMSSQDILHAKNAIEHLNYIASAITMEEFRDILNKDVIEMYLMAGDYHEAEEKSSEMLKISKREHNKKTEYNSLVGLLAAKIGKQDYQSAIVYCNKILEITPDSIFTLETRGNCLADLGQHEEAIVDYGKILSINPKYFQAWFNKGNALLLLNRAEEALGSFEEGLKLEPNNYKLLVMRGTAYFNLGLYDEAIKSYDESLKIYYNFCDVWNIRGKALYNLGRFEEAIKSFDEALKINPDFYDGWYNRGKTLLNMDQFEEALKCFDEVLKINPNYYDAWNNRGIALYLLDRYQEALSSFMKVKELTKDGAVLEEIFLSLLGLYLTMSQVSAANSNSSNAKSEYITALSYLTIIKSDKYKKWKNSFLFEYFKKITNKENIKFVEECLSLLKEKEMNDEYESVKPFVIATNYYESGKDAEILDRLNPEMREIVEEIIQLVEKRSSENKELPK